MLEITPKRLYIIGMCSFAIVAICSIANLMLSWGFLNAWSKIGTLASIIFNFSLAGFFYYMLSLEPKITEEVQSEDIDEIIKEVKKNDERKGRRKA